jgi:hypothetical protein
MKRAAALLLLVAAAAGCDDSGSGPVAPPPEPTAVQIQQDGAAVTEKTIDVGQTVQLTAQVVMSQSGSTPPEVTWRSTNPSVASVANSGLLSGVAPGTALVIATAGPVADTVGVTVTQPPPAEITCGPDAPRITLQPGGVHQVSGSAASLLCLPAAGANAEYVVIPFFASSGPGTLQLEVLGGGITAPALPVHPAREPAGVRTLQSAALAAEPREDWGFHRRMREMERSLAASRTSTLQPRPLLSAAAAAAAVPQVGQIIQLNANTVACENPNFRGARVEAVSQRAIIAADTLNPANGFTRADYEGFAAEFDRDVWPVVTSNFGTPSDVDGNQRVIVFFTRAVNDLTTPGSGSYVGGFYHPRDLFPRTGTSACAGSNVAEVLYQLVPDPARAQANNENFLLRDQVHRRTLAVIAHELQHLVNASIRMLTLNAPMETVWLNEALSHIAEELLFYQQSGLGPEQNITLQTLRASQQTLTAVNRHQISNLGRFIGFLESPSQLNLSDGNDIVTRGGSWAWLRYSADRAATPAQQREIWRNLVSSQLTGINNVAQVFNMSPFDWFQDWTVAVFLDDTALAPEPRFTQPSWNFRSVVPALFEDGRWPLLTHTLSENQPVEFTLRGGGASYLRLAVPADGTAGVRVTSARATPPATLRLSVVRTR